MNNLNLPLFPLELVVYPEQGLNLHIFEPRYKDLIVDALEGDKVFGIPAYVQNKIEYGTIVRITSIEKTYQDGRMDIKTEGLSIFRIHDYENPGPGVRYALGEAEIIEQDMSTSTETRHQFLKICEEFFSILNANATVSLADDTKSFEVAHKIGLTLDEEYEFLQFTSEEIRMGYIINHLTKSIPAIRQMEKARMKIKMNGHFRHFDPLQF